MWETILFKDFIKLNRRFDLPNDKIQEGDIPVVASTSIKGYHNEFKVKAPCVVTGRSGSLGFVQYVNKDCWPLNTTLYVKDYKGNNPRFVYYYLKTMHLEIFNSGAGVPTLNQNHLHFIRVKVPPLPTQQKIADILSAYDDLIENNNRRIELLEQAAQQLYKEWFVRFRFPGYEKVHFTKGIPDGWEVKKIGHIADIMSGGTPKTDNGEYYGGDIPFYTPKDYNNRFFVNDTQTKITYEGLKNCNSKLYPKNTIVITARGTVGKINILSRPMAMNQSCYALKCEMINSPYYLFFSLKNEVDKLLKMANGGVFETIIVSTFNYIQMFVPNNELIIDFDKKVSPIMDECVELQSQNQNLIKQRDLLLPRLMSGKLEV